MTRLLSPKERFAQFEKVLHASKETPSRASSVEKLIMGNGGKVYTLMFNKLAILNQPYVKCVHFQSNENFLKGVPHVLALLTKSVGPENITARILRRTRVIGDRLVLSTEGFCIGTTQSYSDENNVFYGHLLRVHHIIDTETQSKRLLGFSTLVNYDDSQEPLVHFYTFKSIDGFIKNLYPDANSGASYHRHFLSIGEGCKGMIRIKTTKIKDDVNVFHRVLRKEVVELFGSETYIQGFRTINTKLMSSSYSALLDDSDIDSGNKLD